MEMRIKDQIMSLLTTPLTVTEIFNKLPKVKSFGTIAYHLKELEKEGIITKEKSKKERGQPTRYKLISKEQLKWLQDYERERQILLNAFLKFVANNQFPEDDFSLRELEKDGYDPGQMGDITSDAVNANLVTMHYSITSKGKRFIKEFMEKKK